MAERTSKLWKMREQFYAAADWSPEQSSYIKNNSLKLDEIAAHVGHFAICLCEFSGEYFDFSDYGFPAVVIEVLAEDGVTVLDLVAWPLNAPEQFLTAVGSADMLGMTNMRSTNKCKFSTPLRVHRTPHDLLKADCRGCVILNEQWGGYWLRQCDRKILAEDLAHGIRLRQMLEQQYKTVRPLPALNMKHLLVPLQRAPRSAA